MSRHPCGRGRVRLAVVAGCGHGDQQPRVVQVVGVRLPFRRSPLRCSNWWVRGVAAGAAGGWVHSGRFRLGGTQSADRPVSDTRRSDRPSGNEPRRAVGPRGTVRTTTWSAGRRGRRGVPPGPHRRPVLRGTRHWDPLHGAVRAGSPVPGEDLGRETPIPTGVRVDETQTPLVREKALSSLDPLVRVGACLRG